MRWFVSLFISALLCSCTTIPYDWQDTRQPARADATADLEACRSYAARQYRPGIPAGEPYLKQQTDEAIEPDNDGQGEWRPDRAPFPTTNINVLPVHDVPVAYTGFPGELDYAPNYLDDILEKCMHDRGWSYLPVTGDE